LTIPDEDGVISEKVYYYPDEESEALEKDHDMILVGYDDYVRLFTTINRHNN